VLYVALADAAVALVYPLRSTSHFLLQWCGHEGHVVEVAKDEPLRNGRARLLTGEWDAAAMLESQPAGSFHLHVFAQVRAGNLPPHGRQRAGVPCGVAWALERAEPPRSHFVYRTKQAVCQWRQEWTRVPLSAAPHAGAGLR